MHMYDAPGSFTLVGGGLTSTWNSAGEIAVQRIKDTSNSLQRHPLTFHPLFRGRRRCLITKHHIAETFLSLLADVDEES